MYALRSRASADFREFESDLGRAFQVFGYYPAWKASRLDPIDALRYE